MTTGEISDRKGRDRQDIMKLNGPRWWHGGISLEPMPNARELDLRSDKMPMTFGRAHNHVDCLNSNPEERFSHAKNACPHLNFIFLCQSQQVHHHNMAERSECPSHISWDLHLTPSKIQTFTHRMTIPYLMGPPFEPQ